MQNKQKNDALWPWLLPGVVLFAGMLLVMLVAEWLSSDIYKLGIYPRKWQGLLGVVLSPLIHGSWMHLWANAFPLLILSFVLFSSFGTSAYTLFGWLYFLSGFWTWCLGRPAYHIGASGLIYALASFLFFAGWRSPNRRAMAITAFVVIFYHQLLYGIFPTDGPTSWEGHVAGLLAGLVVRMGFSTDLKKIFPKPKPLTSPQAPYPYWLYDKPHLIDTNGNILVPEENTQNKEYSPTEQSMPSPAEEATFASQDTQTEPAVATNIKVVYHLVPAKNHHNDT